MAIKLYDLRGSDIERRISPFCWRIKMAFAHKELPVEVIPWQLTDKAAIAASGQEKAPVIFDGDRVIHDSWRIANYLEDTYPDTPSLFGGAAGRGLAQWFNNWAFLVMATSIFPMVLLDIWRTLDGADADYFRTTREKAYGPLESFCTDPAPHLKKLNIDLEPLRRTLKQQPYLSGQQPTYSDYIVFSFLQWARSVSPTKLLQRDDPISAWRERMMDLYDGMARKATGFELYE